jgi:hypothetical protein
MAGKKQAGVAKQPIKQSTKVRSTAMMKRKGAVVGKRSSSVSAKKKTTDRMNTHVPRDFALNATRLFQFIQVRLLAHFLKRGFVAKVKRGRIGYTHDTMAIQKNSITDAANVQYDVYIKRDDQPISFVLDLMISKIMPDDRKPNEHIIDFSVYGKSEMAGTYLYVETDDISKGVMFTDDSYISDYVDMLIANSQRTNQKSSKVASRSGRSRGAGAKLRS